MNLLVVTLFQSLAAYAAGQNFINCFQCQSGTFDGINDPLSGNDRCLMDANNPNSTVPTVTCRDTTKCYTKLLTVLGYAYAIERGCWSDEDDICDEEQSNNCAGTLKTGTCLKCCNTDRCNANFAQLADVRNGMTTNQQTSQTIDCLRCGALLSYNATGDITASATGDKSCLTITNNRTSTVPIVSCPTQCYTNIRTLMGYAYYIERGCWHHLNPDTCASVEDNSCNGILKTGTCFKCCNSSRCNANFAQLDGVRTEVEMTNTTTQTINCFECTANVVGGMTMSSPCLVNPNTTAQTASCSSACYTQIRKVGQNAFSIERGCWDNYDDKDGAANCDVKVDDGCNGVLKTGTCFQCCNTDWCNKNFILLAGVNNGISGSHVMSAMTILPVAMAMIL